MCEKKGYCSGAIVVPFAFASAVVRSLGSAYVAEGDNEGGSFFSLARQVK
jgi:hypothetical protein